VTQNHNEDRAGASPAPTIFIVSNEVGMGIVPENRLARQFRDYQGILNQHIASIADEVYMLIAGISVKIK
jgi:adenosylcobinamide kinase/adenosylcobinamide-phosphate guanylyltransferase